MKIFCLLQNVGNRRLTDSRRRRPASNGKFPSIQYFFAYFDLSVSTTEKLVSRDEPDIQSVCRRMVHFANPS